MEAALDIEEGADVLMVKPAGAYLDILCQLRQLTDLPLAAYQVSGEYAQIHAAAEKGWLDYAATRDESLLAIKRAGAQFDSHLLRQGDRRRTGPVFGRRHLLHRDGDRGATAEVEFFLQFIGCQIHRIAHGQ